MAFLLSSRSKNATSKNGYLGLGQAQSALGNTPTTSTGYTLVTINSQTSYATSLGKINFTFTNSVSYIQSTIDNGDVIYNPNGSGTLFLNGTVVIPDLIATPKFKSVANAATTGSVSLIGFAPRVVDGVTLQLDDKVLVKSQTNPVENGVYTVRWPGTGSNGTWERSSNANSPASLNGTLIVVNSGTTNGGYYYYTDFRIDQTVDVDPVNWYQIITDSRSQNLTLKNIDNSPIGTITPNVGYFTNLQATNTTTSVSTTSGSFVAAGGVGIAKELNVGGITKILDSTSATSTWTGSLQVSGGLGVNGAVYARAVYVDGVPLNTPLWNGGQISNPFYVANIEESYSTMTGALKVLGGVGIGQSLFVGKKIVLESRISNEFVNFTMRNTATNGQSYTWQVGGNDAAGQSGQALREGSLTLYSDTAGQYRFAVAKATGNILIGYETDNATDKLQVNGSIRVGDSQLGTRSITINNTSTTVIDSYSAVSYRTSKYLVQIQDGVAQEANFHVVEIVILLDNAGNVYKSEYGIITTGGEMGSFDVDYNVDGNGLVRLLFTASNSSTKSIKTVRQSVNK